MAEIGSVILIGLAFGILFPAVCVLAHLAATERDPEYCRYCKYNVKDLARCPECGKLTGLAEGQNLKEP